MCGACAREAIEAGARVSWDNASDTPKQASSHTRRAKRAPDLDADVRAAYPELFAQEVQISVPHLFATLPLNLGNDRDAALDWQLMRHLLYRVDVVKAAKSRLYYPTTISASAVARRAHVRKARVLTSLQRLQQQHRIYVDKSCGLRGRRLLIGVKDFCLFAPVLTPARLFNLTIANLLGHRQRGTPSDELSLAFARAHDQLPWLDDPQERMRLALKLAELEALNGVQPAKA